MTNPAPMSTVPYEAAAAPRPWRNGPAVGAPAADGATALHLFRASPPQCLALQYFDQRLDYATLDRLSDRLAEWLGEQGVGSGDRVALVLQNTPQFVITVLAAWKLAAIAVPLNPMYRGPELSGLFADCEPAAIVCHDDRYAAVLAAAGERLHSRILWTSPREFQSRNDERVLPGASPAPAAAALASVLARPEAALPERAQSRAQDVAVLLYTSGTTGVPKGAMLTHANLVFNARTCVRHFGLGQAARIFGIAPLFHVTGFVIQMVTGFAAQASMVLTYRFQPALVLDAFLEHRPTFVIGAITAFIALMNQPQARREHFQSFIDLYSGGAPIAPAVVDAFQRQFGRAIRSSYGMTELTAPSHLAPRSGPIPVDPASGALSIGQPTPGIDAIVVDEQGVAVGSGVHGEVAVRGPNVMAGYWRKPQETAEVLRDGWMHTGDVGFFDGNGWCYLVDRKKDMICASGFKVWPREVEDVLYQFSGVHEAAVVGAPDAYRGETVVAFVSPQQGAELDPQALARHCRERLAAYKCPVAVNVLPELPKTESGKITRAVLARQLRGAERINR